jgi:hypothetical protein
MSTNDAPDRESIEPRTRRALTEPLSVLSLDGTPVRDTEETIVQVVSHSGESYRVDVLEGRCTCPDAEYNLAPDESCKHARRARAVLGVEPVDSRVIDAVEVDENLGANAPGPVVATADGGIIDAGDEGVILDEGDERPEGCSCHSPEQELPCWPCYRRGFDVPNPEEPGADE